MTKFIVKYSVTEASLAVLFGALQKASVEGIELISIIADESSPVPVEIFSEIRQKRAKRGVPLTNAERKAAWVKHYKPFLLNAMVPNKHYNINYSQDMEEIRPPRLDGTGKLQATTVGEILGILARSKDVPIEKIGDGLYVKRVIA